MATIVEFLKAGTTSWVAPAGVTLVKIECIGPGGYGAVNSGNRHGGGGGGYDCLNGFPVTPGTSYPVQVGTSFSTTAMGYNPPTWFNSDTTVIGRAGQNGAANTSTSVGGGVGVGNVTFPGGRSANGSGGGAAGPNGPGGASLLFGGQANGTANGGAANGGTDNTADAGGANRNAVPGGVRNNDGAGFPGSNGSGGGFGTTVGGAGSQDTIWTDTRTGETAGPGSGAGGCSLNAGADPVGYGAGGPVSRNGVKPGGPGIIVLTYQITINGTSTKTLQPLTGLANGGLNIIAVGGGTLAPLAVVSVGESFIEGQLSGQLGSLTGSFIGGSELGANVSANLGELRVSSTGRLTISGELNAGLSPLTGLSSANLESASGGRVSRRLDRLTAISTGDVGMLPDPLIEGRLLTRLGSLSVESAGVKIKHVFKPNTGVKNPFSNFDRYYY